MAEITSKASLKSIFHEKKTGKKAEIWPRPMLLRPPCKDLFILCQSMREWWPRTDRETLTGFIGACGETSLCSAAAWSRLGSECELRCYLHSYVFCQFTEPIFFFALWGDFWRSSGGMFTGCRRLWWWTVVRIKGDCQHTAAHVTSQRT